MKMGLTGGIATGKSTVCSMFRESGALAVDADQIARDLVQKGQPLWQVVRRHFGESILTTDGEIDRPALGKIVFGDKDQRLWLNRLIHPEVYRQMRQHGKSLRQQYPDRLILYDIPLLFETGPYTDMEGVILVYIPENIQLERLMKRDDISRQDALMRVKAQMPIEEKRKKAGWIIDNSGTFQETEQQVATLYARLTHNSAG